MRMGSNKQYAPNGPNVHSTRRIVASVINSLSGHHTASSSNTTSSSSASGGGLIAQFRSWQRAKRIRASASSMTPLDVDRDTSHSHHHHQSNPLAPMANLCYQSMAAMFSSNSKHKTNNTSTTPTEMINYYKTSESFVNNNNTTTSVAFHNKGDGTIAMQLSNRRLMINENQLYSMNLINRTSDQQITTSVDEPNLSYYMMLEPPSNATTTTDMSNDSGVSQTGNGTTVVLSSENWYYGALSRERAIHMLRACATGSFIVRNSATKENCFALTVRVPYDFNHTGVAHYLIVPTEGGNYKIKGFQKEFHTILSLIIHHSIMREQLPCTLRLNAACKMGEMLSGNYNTTSASRLRTAKSVSRLYAANNNNNNNYGNHYAAGSYLGKSCYDLTSYNNNGSPTNGDTSADDLMVDVDSDPTYQKVLDNFRKAMAQCN